MEKDHIQKQYLADASEFLALDKKFREALPPTESIQSLMDDIRGVILGKGLLQDDEKDPIKALKKRKAEVMAKKGIWPSEVRKCLLDFFDTLLSDPNYTWEKREKTFSADPSLTMHQALMKSEAKALYEAGKYSEAIRLGLRLLHDSSHVQRNPGVLGFLMNCYNKLNKYAEIWKYAKKLLALKNHEPSRADLGMAVYAAYQLGEWDAFLKYGKLLLALNPSDQVLARRIYKTETQITNIQPAA